MTIADYKQRIIAYFKGQPSDAAYEAMAEIVNDWTEQSGCYFDGGSIMKKLHTAVFGPPWECVECGQRDNYFEQCWSCDTVRPATDQEISEALGESP